MKKKTENHFPSDTSCKGKMQGINPQPKKSARGKKRSKSVQNDDYQLLLVPLIRHYDNLKLHEEEMFDIGSLLALRATCKWLQSSIDRMQKGLVRFFTGLDVERGYFEINEIFWVDILYLSIFKSHELDDKCFAKKKKIIKDRYLRFPGIQPSHWLSPIHLLSEATSEKYVIYFTQDFKIGSQKYQPLFEKESQVLCCRMIYWLNHSEINRTIFRKWFYDGKIDLITDLCEGEGVGPYMSMGFTNFKFKSKEMESVWQMIGICYMVKYVLSGEKQDMIWALRIICECCRNRNSYAEDFYLFFYLLGKTKNDSYLVVPKVIAWFSEIFFLKQRADGLNNVIFPSLEISHNYSKIFWLDQEGRTVEGIPTMNVIFGKEEFEHFQLSRTVCPSYLEAESAFVLGTLSHTPLSEPRFSSFNSFKSLLFSDSKKRGSFSLMLGIINNFSPLKTDKPYEKINITFLQSEIYSFWPWKEPPNLNSAIDRLKKFCLFHNIDYLEIEKGLVRYLELDSLFGNFIIEHDQQYYSENLGNPSGPYGNMLDPMTLDVLRYVEKNRKKTSLDQTPKTTAPTEGQVFKDRTQSVQDWFIKYNHGHKKKKLHTLAANELYISLSGIERLDHKNKDKVLATYPRTLLYFLNLTKSQAKSIYKRKIVNDLTQEDWNKLYIYRPIIFLSLVLNCDMEWTIDTQILKECFTNALGENSDVDIVDFFVRSLTTTWGLDHRSFGLLDKIYQGNLQEMSFWWKMWKATCSANRCVLLGLLSPCEILEYLYQLHNKHLISDTSLMIATTKSLLPIEAKEIIAKRNGHTLTFPTDIDPNATLDAWFIEAETSY